MIDCDEDCRGCEQCCDTSEDPEAGCPECGAHAFNRDCATCMEEYASTQNAGADEMKTTLTVKAYDGYPDVSAKLQSLDEALAGLKLPDVYVIDEDVEDGQEPIRTPLKDVFEAFDFSRASSFEVEIVDGSLADGVRQFVGWGDNPAFSSFYDDDNLRVVIDGVVTNHKLETAWDATP